MKMNILTVDNESIWRESIKDVLTCSGHKVEMASNPEAGIEKLKETKFDVAIWDTGAPKCMEEINRLRIDRKYSDNFSELQVIVLTGNDSEDEKKKAEKLGVYKYMIKNPDWEGNLLENIEKIEEEKMALKEDQIYKKYKKSLEKKHKGEFVAISFDERKDRVIIGKEGGRIVDEAIEKFGSGNFVFRRIGYDYITVLR